MEVQDPAPAAPQIYTTEAVEHGIYVFCAGEMRKMRCGGFQANSMSKVKPRPKPVCSRCGSDDLTIGGISRWCIDKQEWELSRTLDNTVCNNCGGQCRLNWIDLAGFKSKKWDGYSLSKMMHTLEQKIILDAINDAGGRVTKAAALLGITHQALSQIIRARHHDLLKDTVQRKPRSARSATNGGGQI